MRSSTGCVKGCVDSWLAAASIDFRASSDFFEGRPRPRLGAASLTWLSSGPTDGRDANEALEGRPRGRLVGCSSAGSGVASSGASTSSKSLAEALEARDALDGCPRPRLPVLKRELLDFLTTVSVLTRLSLWVVSST